MGCPYEAGLEGERGEGGKKKEENHTNIECFFSFSSHPPRVPKA